MRACAAQPALRVLDAGLQTTMQDRGRPGLASWGVGPAGAADHTAYDLAGRLIGNPPGTPALEATLGGLRLLALRRLVVAVTGAPEPVRVDGLEQAANAPFELPPGAELDLGSPSSALRRYVAVRGGLVVETVLGSASSDTLSGIGPAPLAAGNELAGDVGAAEWPGVDVAPVAGARDGPVLLEGRLGPRHEWFTDAALQRLVTEQWQVTADLDRVGVRLDGQPLERRTASELPSEGLVRGAVQVPSDGRPIVFLADRPVTGGYPVIACLSEESADRAGQLRPGQSVRFRLSPAQTWTGGSGTGGDDRH